MTKKITVNFGRMDQEPKLVSPNVRAAQDRERRMVWSAKYGEARGIGMPPADARLHADMAVEVHDREQGGGQ